MRDYFLAKYWKTFNEQYKSVSRGQELHLLKSLIDKYGGDLVLLAIDLFLINTPQEKATINYFGTSKFFDSQYQFLIKIKPILKYRVNPTPEMRVLIDEYIDYSNALFLSTEEYNRKQLILLELEKLNKEI